MRIEYSATLQLIQTIGTITNTRYLKLLPTSAWYISLAPVPLVGNQDPMYQTNQLTVIQLLLDLYEDAPNVWLYSEVQKKQRYFPLYSFIASYS